MAISSEATPLQASQDPSLMQAGFKRVLLYTVSSIFYICESAFCWHFMNYAYSGNSTNQIVLETFEKKVLVLRAKRARLLYFFLN